MCIYIYFTFQCKCQVFLTLMCLRSDGLLCIHCKYADVKINAYRPLKLGSAAYNYLSTEERNWSKEKLLAFVMSRKKP